MSDLLARWPLRTTNAQSWLDQLSGAPAAKAVLNALLDPQLPEEILNELLSRGEWEGALLLLEEVEFQRCMDRDRRRVWQATLEGAQRQAVQEAGLAVERLREKARVVGGTLDRVERLPEQFQQSQAAGQSLLREFERSLHQAEESWKARLRQDISEVPSLGDSALAVLMWRDSVERHLELGMLAEAKELVDRGPSDDVVGNEWLPPRLRGPLSFVKEPLRNLLQWFFDEFPAPPDFKSLRPTTNDTVAWRLLEVLHRPQGDQGDVFLRCLAAIMGTEIAKLYRDLDGWTAHFLDLSAPGFPALGRRRWSQGVEVWLPRDPEAPERELSPGQLRIRIVLEAEPPPRSGVLYLKIQNVLMALSRPDRRRMLLSSLGSQVPLSQLFDAREADLSARWPRDELLKLKGRKGKPLLLVGCPGIGKSVFLQELSEQTRAPLLVSVDDDIPEAPLVLIDCPVVLDSREAKRMVKAIYWQLGEQPDAGLIVAARPEVALLLKEVREDFFEIKLLEPRPIAVMRQQAEGMLGWGGIEASEEGGYERLAWLSGGNPTVLFQLCCHLALHLAERKGGGRRFGMQDVEAVWREPTMRAFLKELFWGPLKKVYGVDKIILYLLQYSDPAHPLTDKDVEELWREDGLPDLHLRSKLQMIEWYGMVQRRESEIHLSGYGPGLLLPEWIAENES